MLVGVLNNFAVGPVVLKKITVKFKAQNNPPWPIQVIYLFQVLFKVIPHICIASFLRII